ncbi:MAG: hypothetical protein KGI60_03560 [Patescibacteria group bacterium]|nr:hypothetical protein [Patescibacteria group bacterium]
MNDIQKKDVVIGLIKGYDFEILRPFVMTLKKTGYAGDVVFFHAQTDKGTLEKLKDLGVILIPFDEKFPYGADAGGHERWSGERMKNLGIYCLRYLLAYRYLAANENKYKRVMLSDTRDVIFQKDPFDFSVHPLCCFIEHEGSEIQDSPVNAEWIRTGFGPEEFEHLRHKPIICSGITIGSTQGILRYLEIFLDTIVNKDVPAHLRGMDQGIHNYLIHEGKVESSLYKNNEGPVFTLGLEDDVRLKGGYIHNANGGIPNVVHQYDRHWRLAWHYWSLRLILRDYYSLWRARFRRIFGISKKQHA